jgi:hypothetical protein
LCLVVFPGIEYFAAKSTPRSESIADDNRHCIEDIPTLINQSQMIDIATGDTGRETLDDKNGFTRRIAPDIHGSSMRAEVEIARIEAC